MNKCLWRLVLVAGTAVVLTACGNRETKQALQKASGLEDQKQYQDANEVLVDSLRAREASIRAAAGTPADQAATDALNKKVQGDPEILKMERAQIPLYLHLERADLASAVYGDILTGNPTDTVVYDLLHDKDPVIRTGAVRILGLEGKSDAIAALAGATKDQDQVVRRAAIASLGALKGPETVPPLIDALNDPYWFARSEAASALGQEHDARAIKPLLDTVASSVKLQETSPEKDSIKLVETSAESALIFLAKAEVPPDEFAAHLSDAEPKVVLISAVCLAILKDSRSIPVLTKLITSPDQTARLDAVKGLGETGDPSVLPTLRQTLKDPDVNMRGWSIIGLGNLKDVDSLPDLRALAADPAQPDSIKAAASAAVNHIAPPAPPVAQ